MSTTNNFFSGKGNGYASMRAEVDERVAASHSRTTDLSKKMSDMRSQFYNASASANHESFNTPKAESTKAIYPTDLMPSVKIEVPQVKAEARIDVNNTVNEKPADPSAERSQVEATREQYKQMDATIKEEFIKELKAVDRDVGDTFAKITGPSSSGSTLAEVAKAADPGIGDIYTVISKLMKEPNNDRVNAALDKAMSNLQKATDTQNNLAKQGKASPPLIDWNAFGKQNLAAKIDKYFSRNIDDDKLMQDLDVQERKIEVKEANFTDYRDKYETGLAKTTIDKVEQAVNAGQEGLVKALLQRDDNKVQAAMKGHAADAVVRDSGDIQLAKLGNNVEAVAADKAKVVEITSGAKEVAKAFLNMEPKDMKLKPELSSGMAA